MDDLEYAAATPEQRKSYDDMCRAEDESEMAAERFNEMVMAGISQGPDPDEAYERYLESLEQRF